MVVAVASLIDLPGQGTRYAVRITSRGTGSSFIACSGDEGIGLSLFKKYRDAVKYRDELVMHGLPRGKVIRVHVMVPVIPTRKSASCD